MAIKDSRMIPEELEVLKMIKHIDKLQRSLKRTGDRQSAKQLDLIRRSANIVLKNILDKKIKKMINRGVHSIFGV